MENELIVTNMNSVACVCATLVTSDDVDLLSEHVYDLSLSFITPLASDDDCAGTLIRHDVPYKTTKKKRVRPRRGTDPRLTYPLGKAIRRSKECQRNPLLFKH